jgi:hypothetical protein
MRLRAMISSAVSSFCGLLDDAISESSVLSV